MSAPTESLSSSKREIQVAMPVVVKFVRQLAHDLRNHLNAAELQSAYLAEIAENPELRDEIKRLRGMIAQIAGNLQQVTAVLGQPRLTEMPYLAKDLIEDLKDKLASAYPDETGNVKWDETVGDAALNIDPQFLLPALMELFANAFRHDRGDGAIIATAQTEKGTFTFRLSEPKRDFQGSTEAWGMEPFRVLGQGHYGLGLHRTRAVVEAHGGEFSARYDKAASSLVTTATFPLAAPGA